MNLLFNKKLKDEDIRKMTDIPIVGNIPHSAEKTNTVVFDNPNSTIAEAFRLLTIEDAVLYKRSQSSGNFDNIINA